MAVNPAQIQGTIPVRAPVPSSPTYNLALSGALKDKVSENGEFAPQAHRGTVAIQTHGCKLNQADSNILARQFLEAGYRIVERASEADIFVLNTCTVTATADAKARHALRAARRSNPTALVVAAGCYPQRAAEELASMPAVSLVVGNSEKDRLVSLVTEALQGAGQRNSGLPASGNNGAAAIANTGANTGTEAAAPAITPGKILGRSRAMIKIQEGCNQVCAYCIVPKVRGRERSIPPELLSEQIRQRVNEGCQEVVLTGTQLGTYGFDLPGITLEVLLQRILAETGVPRLRVSSLQPQEISLELLRLWQTDSRLCPHFHMPLQSGSDPILKAMRRRYTTQQFAQKADLIRQTIPDAGITADLIVGFPGEGEEEFRESRAFVEAIGFSDMHVFPYSKRPGTSATYLGSQVPEPVKKERTAEILQLARQSFEQFRRGQLGRIRPVLWESARERGGVNEWRGLTDNYIRVHTTCPDSLALHNVVTPARLVELTDGSVRAQPV